MPEGLYLRYERITVSSVLSVNQGVGKGIKRKTLNLANLDE